MKVCIQWSTEPMTPFVFLAIVLQLGGVGKILIFAFTSPGSQTFNHLLNLQLCSSHRPLDLSLLFLSHHPAPGQELSARPLLSRLPILASSTYFSYKMGLDAIFKEDNSKYIIHTIIDFLGNPTTTH